MPFTQQVQNTTEYTAVQQHSITTILTTHTVSVLVDSHWSEGSRRPWVVVTVQLWPPSVSWQGGGFSIWPGGGRERWERGGEYRSFEIESLSNEVFKSKIVPYTGHFSALDHAWAIINYIHSMAKSANTYRGYNLSFFDLGSLKLMTYLPAYRSSRVSTSKLVIMHGMSKLANTFNSHLSMNFDDTYLKGLS